MRYADRVAAKITSVISASLLNAQPESQLPSKSHTEWRNGTLAGFLGFRNVKSPAEIALMKKAGVLVNKVMQTAVDTIQVGVRECDAAAAVLHAQVTGTDDRFLNEISINLELAGCVRRYHCPLSRTIYLGKNPQKKLTETAQWTVDALNAELEAVRPGVTCEQVDQAWLKAISHTGIVKESQTGYAMGLRYPPDWGEHTCCMRPGDQTMLQPGMTFHLISGIWMEDWGFEVSESVLVTETGYELFASFSRQLIVKAKCPTNDRSHD